MLRAGHDSVYFVHVDVAREELERRLRERRGHYMPPSLLDSQLAALQPLGDDEPGTTVPGDGAIETVVEHVIAALRAERGLR
jgi:gluconokinase